jgi:catechol 2,3-dioxygenase
MSSDSGNDAHVHHSADPRVHIGHVHLKVADLERALSFYSGVLGLK